MPLQSPESLVEERVAQLEAISQRRNELLREMYHLMQRRQTFGGLCTSDDSELLFRFYSRALERCMISTNSMSKEGSVYTDPFDIPEPPQPKTSGKRKLSRSGRVIAESTSPFKFDTAASPDAEGSHNITLSRIEEVGDTEELASSSKVPIIHDKEELDSISINMNEELLPPSQLPSAHIVQQQNIENNVMQPNSAEAPSSAPPSHMPWNPKARNVERGRQRSTSHMVHSAFSYSDQGAYTGDDDIMEDQTGVSQDTRNGNFAPNADHLMHVEPSASPVPQGPLVHSIAVEVQQLQTSFLIPKPSSPILDLPAFHFEDSPVTDDTSQQPLLPERHHRVYTLPPLKSLPAEFTRKGKSAKQRKRDRDRERNDKDKVDVKKDGKDEWAPMGPNRWGAVVRANPIWKKVARATKCLSTREWSVAMTELRLIRTLERVEALKGEGKWSFRQPKKQRGVGGLTKTHWDYLMDEMKWMRIDFREERRWKFVLAFNLSTAVLEWHAVGSREERLKLGICVLWKRSRVREASTGDTLNGSSQYTDADSRPVEQEEIDYTPMADDSDNEDDEPDHVRQNIVDPLETTTTIDDALVGATETAHTDNDHDQDPIEYVQPKVEDVDDSYTLRESNDNEADDAMDVDGQQDDGNDASNAKNEDTSSAAVSLGLKSGSVNPVLGYQSLPDSESSTSVAKSSSRSLLYAPLRERIAYSDPRKLFLDVDDFDIVKGFSSLSTADQAAEPSLPPPDLSDIFPDLQPLGMLNVAPVLPTTSSENKKKMDKKSDRDDPNKRSEDTTYTKLAPIGRFMHCKPTLLGPLQPAKHWKNGKWINMEEPTILVEYEGPMNKSIDEISCALFDGNKPLNPATVNPVAPPVPPKESKKRAGDHAWGANEDVLLKSLVDKYPNNWGLIADSFNSCRVAISTDKRTPWDCLERWTVRYAANRMGQSAIPPDLGSPAALDGTPPPTGPPAQVQMTTRGVKRLASASVAAGSGPGNADSKKRRRHTLMYETMRKAAKKRETAQKAALNQKKPSAIHDTHGQYTKMPKYTPAELSRMKAEKEAREQQEILLARRRHEEHTRQQQQLMRDPRMQGVQVNQQTAMQQQQQQQQQQTPNGVARPTGAVPQGVPQIRSQPVPQVNISQQQRIPTPMAAAAARLSPQQMIQAQAQAAQARAIAAAQAQAQAQVQAQAQGSNIATNVNGVAPGTHLSPPYSARASTSSPAIPQQASPPRTAPTPTNSTNSPRPSSAQPQIGVVQVSQVPGNVAPRPASSIPAHYFPAVGGAQFTHEQMEQAVRLQNLIQAQHGRSTMSQATQNNQYHSQT
ncbi:hypothetical protein SERLA73DRAFT_76187 [Serpula lacrymans var. lacrymans S7.3]|uniref:Vacuolar import and degradation protein 21 n=1 Tax=Serpula lacrymans var. lacrymans (strain S7.3) TaxID=936435 RepID=F8Q6H1_SERL3|nr:hypothetical protein SERLA73DRAFT_76187 [Serpula lacrymans var. lacrymans S7.3]